MGCYLRFSGLQPLPHKKVEHMKLPHFDDLLAQYPAGTSSQQVKQAIGGGVDADFITNTCAVRLSRALNYCPGHAIPKLVTLLTVTGADHKRYGLRVKEMQRFLKRRYSQPTVVEAATNGVIDKTKFLNKTGIITFDVVGWEDATGHFTLWDGEFLIWAPGHDYFNFSIPAGPHVVKASLWVC